MSKSRWFDEEVKPAEGGQPAQSEPELPDIQSRHNHELPLWDLRNWDYMSADPDDDMVSNDSELRLL